MKINSIEVFNFRNIKHLKITPTEENKVICFVGENGSSKTSLIGLIAEAIVSRSNLTFPDFDGSSDIRFRLLNNGEISMDEKFYSHELIFSTGKSEKYNFKKLVARGHISPKEYSHAIKGITLGPLNSNELFTTNAKVDHLAKNLFLLRPGNRYEQDGFEDRKNVHANYSMGVQMNGSMPYSISVSHIGDDLQKIIIDLILDITIGYNESDAALEGITDLLNRITMKDFGTMQIGNAPFRQVMSSNFGLLRNLSQGELDLLTTISCIISRQLFIYREMSEREQEEINNNFYDVPGVVIIDEVDLHLHPRAQETYLSILTETFKNIQFIITTHSPFIIRGLPSNSLVIRLPSGEVFNKPFSAMSIDNITNVIFNYSGGFSKNTQDMLNTFRAELTSGAPNMDTLRAIYKELSLSTSAKEEIDLQLASYAHDAEIIKTITEA
ncbi:MAG: AAA family ATPase [Aeromonas jandaei]